MSSATIYGYPIVEYIFDNYNISNAIKANDLLAFCTNCWWSEIIVQNDIPINNCPTCKSTLRVFTYLFDEEDVIKLNKLLYNRHVEEIKKTTVLNRII